MGGCLIEIVTVRETFCYVTLPFIIITSSRVVREEKRAGFYDLVRWGFTPFIGSRVLPVSPYLCGFVTK